MKLLMKVKILEEQYSLSSKRYLKGIIRLINKTKTLELFRIKLMN